MIRATGLLLAATLGLAACVQPSAPSGPVGPGATAPDAGTTALLFRDVCLANLPDLNQTRSALAAGPFRQDSGSGIYYHNALDLSFKVRSEAGTPVCSVVAGLAGNAGGFGAAIAALAVPTGLKVNVGSPLAAGDRTYVSAFAAAP